MNVHLKAGSGLLVPLSVLVAAAAAFTFFPPSDHRAFDSSAETKAALTWMKNPNPSDQLSTTLGGREEHPLDKDDYRPVIEGKEKSAEAMLDSTSWVRLEETEARIMTGYVRTGDKRVPYLVRGLSSSGAGGTRIYLLPNAQIAVSGGALSHRPVRLRKQCFVACLDFAPTAVWVSYSVAE